jgi:hypothetical protein
MGMRHKEFSDVDRMAGLRLWKVASGNPPLTVQRDPKCVQVGVRQACLHQELQVIKALV